MSLLKWVKFAFIFASIGFFIYDCKCRATCSSNFSRINFPSSLVSTQDWRSSNFIVHSKVTVRRLQLPDVMCATAYKVMFVFNFFKKFDMLVWERFRTIKIPIGFRLICNSQRIPMALEIVISTTAIGRSLYCRRFTTAHFWDSMCFVRSWAVLFFEYSIQEWLSSSGEE